MKRTITLLMTLILWLTTPLLGQLSIPTNEFSPAPGTELDYHQAHQAFESSDFNALMSGSGGPQVWDFSSWDFPHSQTNHVVDPASVPSIGNFPEANHAQLIVTNVDDSTWQLYRSTPSLFMHLGSVAHFGSNETMNVLEDIAPEWVFPLNYGNEWTSHRHSTTPSAHTYTKTYDTTQHSADAWGTVVYNAKSQPCLRVVSEQRILTITYDLDDNPIATFEQNVTSVNFMGEGFEYLFSATKAVFLTTEVYTLTTTGDFLETPTSVRQVDSETLPRDFKLSQNYPNPFNPRTDIDLTVPRQSHVNLTVYDILGRKVRTLIDKSLSAGSYVASWDGTDYTGARVASGVYFYRVSTDDYAESRKMVLLK